MSKSPAKNWLQLELHVPDFELVKDYYGKLGFKIVDLGRKDPEYLVMQLEGNFIRFWPGNQKTYEQPYFKQFPKESLPGYGVELVVMVKDIQQFYKDVKPFANVVEPLTKRPWGLSDFRAADPFGYYLRFTSRHNVLGAPSR